MGGIVKRLMLLGALVLVASIALAEQSAGPWTNLRVCTAPGGRAGAKIISDGRGGAIVAWSDQRNEATPSKLDVYIQRINAGGIAKWTADGVPLCTGLGDQYNVALATDGDGGAIAAWSDRRDGRGYVFAQRVDDRGRALWAPDGISVAPSQGGWTPRVVSDGLGGALIAWQYLGGRGSAIYAQRLDPEGRGVWGSSGAAVCTAPGFHYAPSVVSDGGGGAIITWTDMRQARGRIFGQHIDARGIAVWALDGIPVCDFASEQRGGDAVSDGAGGAIVVWKDSRKARPDTLGLFAQRVDGLGHLLWDRGGVDLCKRPLNDDLFIVACGTRGGAVVGWHDRRSGQYDIYAQGVSAAGTTKWAPDGVAVCVAPGDQVYPAITSDERGGAFFAWLDFRGGAYVQHVDDNSDVLWGAAGVPVSTTGFDYPSIAGDGRSGAFVAWTDSHGGLFDFDVLAERITDSGLEGRKAGGKGPTPSSTRVAVAGWDGNGFSILLSTPAATKVQSTIYDVAGRRVRVLATGLLESGEHQLRWDARDEMGRRVSAGTYFVRVQTAQGEQTVRAVLTR